MFVVVSFHEGKPGHARALREALLMHAVTTLQRDPRCRRFDVSADPVDTASFLVYAIFDDEAAHKAHQESQHYANYAILVEPWIASKRVLTYKLISEPATSDGSVPPTHPGGHA